MGCQLRVMRAMPSAAAGDKQNSTPQALQPPAMVAERPATVQADTSGQPAAAPTSAAMNEVKPAHGAALCIADEVELCIACALRKMAIARIALDSLNATSEQCNQYLHVLRECALALAALRRV